MVLREDNLKQLNPWPQRLQAFTGMWFFPQVVQRTLQFFISTADPLAKNSSTWNSCQRLLFLRSLTTSSLHINCFWTAGAPFEDLLPKNCHHLLFVHLSLSPLLFVGYIKFPEFQKFRLGPQRFISMKLFKTAITALYCACRKFACTCFWNASNLDKINERGSTALKVDTVPLRRCVTNKAISLASKSTCWKRLAEDLPEVELYLRHGTALSLLYYRRSLMHHRRYVYYWSAS